MKPLPGSPDAVKIGCTCPVLDNAHGRGIPVTTDEGEIQTAFWIDGTCPVHGAKEEAKDE